MMRARISRTAFTCVICVHTCVKMRVAMTTMKRWVIVHAVRGIEAGGEAGKNVQEANPQP